MLTISYGMPGSGKGLHAIMAMEQALMRRRKVVTNIKLSKACPWRKYVGFLSNRDVWDGKEGFWSRVPNEHFIVIDEADNFFDADWGRMASDKFGSDDPDVVTPRTYFKQHRHYFHDLLLVTQCIDNLWIRIKRVATQHLYCEWSFRTTPLHRDIPIGWTKFHYITHVGVQLKPDAVISQGFQRYSVMQRYFDYYESDQIIGAGGGIRCLT